MLYNSSAQYSACDVLSSYVQECSSPLDWLFVVILSSCTVRCRLTLTSISQCADLHIAPMLMSALIPLISLHSLTKVQQLSVYLCHCIV